jgi:hypothetical protein
LLAEPEDPSVFRGAGQSSRRRTRWFSIWALEGRTYVRAAEGVNGQCREPRGRCCCGTLFSHGGALLLVRERGREVFGWYARRWWCGGGEGG